MTNTRPTTRPARVGASEAPGVSNGGVAIRQHSATGLDHGRDARGMSEGQRCWAHVQAAREALITCRWLASHGRPLEAAQEAAWALHDAALARALNPDL